MQVVQCLAEFIHDEASEMVGYGGAIFAGPPPEKPDIGIDIPGIPTIHCRDGWSLEPVRMLLSELLHDS